MKKYLLAFKDWFITSFNSNPKLVFNILFFGGLVILLEFVYLSFHKNPVEAEAFVKNEIKSMKDEERLDTLRKLLHGDNITIREFPYTRTYTVSLAVNKLDNNSRIDGYYYSVTGEGFSWVTIDNNKYLYKKQSKDWQKDSLSSTGEMISLLRSDYLYSSSPYSVATPIYNGPKHELQFVTATRSKCQPLKLTLEDSLKDYSFQPLCLENGIFELGSNSEFNDRINYFRPIIKQAFSEIIKTPLKVYRVAGNNLHLATTLPKDYIFNPFYNNYNLYFLKPHQSKDTLIDFDKNGFDIYSQELTSTSKPIFVHSFNHYNVDGLNNFLADDDNLLYLNQVKNRINVYNLITDDPKKDTAALLSIKVPAGVRFRGSEIYNDQLWLIGYNEENIFIIRASLDPGSKNPIQPPVIIPASNPYNYFINLSSDHKITLFMNTSNGDKTFVTTDCKSVTKPDKADELFLSRVKEAALYLPKYCDNGCEYVASYNNGIALVQIDKNDNKYNYKFIGDINWPVNLLIINPNTDVFYIVILSALILTSYFILYFICRNYFTSNILEVDYGENSVFKHLPLLKTKVRLMENDMKQLKLRSDYMLALGITFGVGGVLASIITFQETEATIGNSWGSPHTFLGIFRPVILLAFIETFTFYFLKQYRIIFNEYKRFYSAFLNLSAYFDIIELEAATDIKDTAKNALTKKLSDENIMLYENNIMKQFDEFDNNAIKSLADAIKSIKGG